MVIETMAGIIPESNSLTTPINERITNQMGLLCDFFIAEAEPIPNYDGLEFPSSDRIQLRHISSLQCAQFLAVLRGQKYSVTLLKEFVLLTPQDADEWTMHVPEDMVEKLAQTKNDQISKIAEQFSKATSAELGWSSDDFVPIVSDLCGLARRALESKKKMYLWNSI